LIVLVSASKPAAILTWGPLRSIGSASYSMYLFHYAAYPALARIFPHAGTLRDFSVLIGGSVAVFLFAKFTGYAIERPFNRLKDMFQYARHPGEIPSDNLAGDSVLAIEANI